MKKNLNLRLSILLCLLIVTLFAPFSAAGGQKKRVYTAKEGYEFPMWHYSGNYWIIGSGSNKVKVYDSDIEQCGGLEAYLAQNYSTITFSVELPAELKQALNEGYSLEAGLESRGNTNWKDLFHESSYEPLTTLTAGSEVFSFSISPRYSLVEDRDFCDFVSGLTRSIPLISKNFGYNIYSVYGNGKTAVQVNGWYDAGEHTRVCPPYIHPSIIKDQSGALVPSHLISVDGKTVLSDGFSVGSGTFANAGAYGIHFSFPLNVVFYASPPEDSSGDSGENPPNEGGENPGGGDGGSEEPGSGEEEPELPLPEEELSFAVIRALLSLPPESFEGHPVTATDISSIEVDEILYTAAQAYAKKLASGSIRSEGASCRKLDSTQTELLYAQPGVYMAELEVCAATGEYANDSRSIRVLPCPAVSAELGGCQKQNRRQSLTVTALQNPAHPLISLRISISEPISGEKINVSYSFGGAQSAPVCSSNIKYRSLEDAGSDEYRVVVRLDFLTKFDEDRILNFEINAKDGRGNTASAASQFKVVKDLPPVAKIELADCYYRSENSNIAVINASDAAEGSGNLKRIWDCEGEYTDLSFGSAKNISFLRSGVGNFSVGLTVTDLWSEDTLPEYVSESDHLSSHAAAFSVVDNIAPTVSLELRPAKSIDVLLLAQSERAFELARAKIPQLKAKLSEEGIAANIQIALQHNAGVEVGGTPYLLRQISSPISEKLAGAKRLSFPDIRSPFWNCGHVSADASKIYSMDSSTLSVRSSHGGVSYMKRTYPYHIKAFDANTGEEKWTFNFSENVFPSPSEFKNARLGHDAQEKYLYLISDGKTLLLDKATGTMIKVLDSELGVNNCCREGRIYSFKEDGIYRIDTDGSESKIYGAEIFCGNNRIRTIAGDELFVERRGFALYLGRFNAETENVSSAALQGTENLSDNKSDCAAIDSRGIVVIRISPCEYRAFGSDGKLLRRTLLDPRTQESVPSFDASSRANYIAGSFMEVTGSAAEENRYYFNYASMNSLLGDYSDSNYIRSGREGYYRSINQVAYAMETAESYIGMVLPCSVIYANDAIYSKMTEFNFNAKTGAKDIGIMTSTGVPPTGFCGHFEGGSFIGMYHTAKNNIALVVKISESEADEIERLKTKWLPDGENSSCISVDESWDVNTAAAELASKYASDTEAPEKIYRKGETIEYKLFYSDYEGDESKASFWCYEHTPYSDGLFKDSGKILNAPVTSFSQDGKYVLTHWQTDDAGRGKTTAFDKESKPFRMVFYIEGGANAPKVKSIGTEPGKVMVGASYSIKTVVDDRDKDELSVTIEVFRKGESEPVKSYTKNALKAVNGVYPEVVLADMPKAEAGSYEVVVSVRDATGSGAGVYGFRPEVANSLEGMVGHTDDWESNRQSFNLKYFGRTGASETSSYADYCKTVSPRFRGKNVFWPGEKLMLSALVGGEIKSLSAAIPELGYSCTLSACGEADENGLVPYSGVLYNSGMMAGFSKNNPRLVVVRFTAKYEDGSTKTQDASIIFDYDIGYWMLHRTK